MRIYILDIKETSLNSLCVYGKRDNGDNVFIQVPNFPRFCYVFKNYREGNTLIANAIGSSEMTEEQKNQEFLEALDSTLANYYSLKGIVKRPVKVAFDKDIFKGFDDDEIPDRSYLITFTKSHYGRATLAELASRSSYMFTYGFSSVFGEVSDLLQAFMLAIDYRGPGWYNVDPGLLDRVISDKPNKINAILYNMRHPKNYFSWSNHITPYTSKVDEDETQQQHPPLDIAFCYSQSFKPTESDKKIPSVMTVRVLKRVKDLSEVNIDHAEQLNYVIVNKEALYDRTKMPQRRHYHAYKMTTTSNFAKAVCEVLSSIKPDILISHGALFEIGECEASFFDIFADHDDKRNLSILNKSNSNSDDLVNGMITACRKHKTSRLAPYEINDNIKSLFAGIVCCDVATVCKRTLNARSYYLDYLVNFHNRGEYKSLLAAKYTESESKIKALNNFARFSFDPTDLEAAIDHHHVALDAICVLEQSTNALYLTLNNSIMTKSTWNESLAFTKKLITQRLLSSAFHRRGYALPNSGRDRRVPKFKGGAVLEPEKGLIKTKVLWYDFSSQYPSIIKEFDICHTTLGGTFDVHPDAKMSLASLVKKRRSSSYVHRGVIPGLIAELIETKNSLKAEISKLDASNPKHAKKYKKLSIAYKCIKEIINSFYGALGHDNNIFCHAELAKMITRLGREALESAISVLNERLKAEENGSKTIYADTDSTSIDTKSTESPKKLIEKYEPIRQEINAQFSAIKLEFESVFGRILFVSKKRYIGYKWNPATNVYELDVKGLEMIKKDWPPLLGKCINEFIPLLLSEGQTTAASYEKIREIIQKWIDGIKRDPVSLGLQLEDFCISNVLDKTTTDTPHVMLANRTKSTHGVRYVSNTVVSYIYVRNTPLVNNIFRGVELTEKYGSVPVDMNEVHALAYEACRSSLSEIIDTEHYANKYLINPLAKLFSDWKVGTENAEQVQKLLELLCSSKKDAAISPERETLSFLKKIDQEGKKTTIGFFGDAYASLYGKREELEKIIESNCIPCKCEHCNFVFAGMGIFKQPKASSDADKQHLQLVDDLICSFICPKCTRDLPADHVVRSLQVFVDTWIKASTEMSKLKGSSKCAVKRRLDDYAESVRDSLDISFYEKLKSKTNTTISVQISLTPRREKIALFERLSSKIKSIKHKVERMIDIKACILEQWNK